MWAAAGGRESSAAAVLRVLLIATACGLVFALLRLPLPDGGARSAGLGEPATCLAPPVAENPSG